MGIGASTMKIALLCGLAYALPVQPLSSQIDDEITSALLQSDPALKEADQDCYQWCVDSRACTGDACQNCVKLHPIRCVFFFSVAAGQLGVELLERRPACPADSD